MAVDASDNTDCLTLVMPDRGAPLDIIPKPENPTMEGFRRVQCSDGRYRYVCKYFNRWDGYNGARNCEAIDKKTGQQRVCRFAHACWLCGSNEHRMEMHWAK